MRGACVYYTGTNRHLLKNYQNKINLLRYTLGICTYQLQKCSKYRNISPPIFSEIFHQGGNNYNLRIDLDFAMTNVRFVFHGSDSIWYLGHKIWDILPLELKELTSVAAFRKSIKEWKPKNCPCRLCKKYISNLGFITVTS